MKHILYERFNKTCPVCNTDFIAENNSQVYCSLPCRIKNQKQKISNADWRKTPKKCKMCSKEFIIPENSSPIRAYCSKECQIKGYKVNVIKFRELNPESMNLYNKVRRKKYGDKDTLVIRLRKKYPDLPKCCEAKGCSESRVIELAHKPEHKRNGACRVLKYYERHMFWVLCPTHHALIDRAGFPPIEFGLK